MSDIWNDAPSANSLRLAKVVESHPKVHAVDVVFMDDGAFAYGVPVLSGVAGGQQFGESFLPEPDLPKEGKWIPTLSETKDVLCVIGFASSQPLVVGFLHPQVGAMGYDKSSDYKDMYLKRHTSGTYEQIAQNGAMRINAPKFAASISIHEKGGAGAVPDLSGDYDGEYKQDKGKPGEIRLAVGSSYLAVTEDELLLKFPSIWTDAKNWYGTNQWATNYSGSSGGGASNYDPHDWNMSVISYLISRGFTISPDMQVNWNNYFGSTKISGLHPESLPKPPEGMLAPAAFEYPPVDGQPPVELPPDGPFAQGAKRFRINVGGRDNLDFSDDPLATSVTLTESSFRVNTHTNMASSRSRSLTDNSINNMARILLSIDGIDMLDNNESYLGRYFIQIKPGEIRLFNEDSPQTEIRMKSNEILARCGSTKITIKEDEIKANVQDSTKVTLSPDQVKIDVLEITTAVFKTDRIEMKTEGPIILDCCAVKTPNDVVIEAMGGGLRSHYHGGVVAGEEDSGVAKPGGAPC